MAKLTNFSKLIIFIIFLFIPAFVGYIKCWNKFIKSDFDGTKTTFKREIIYGVGLVPPIGCFIGWMNIKDEKI